MQGLIIEKILHINYLLLFGEKGTHSPLQLKYTFEKKMKITNVRVGAEICTLYENAFKF